VKWGQASAKVRRRERRNAVRGTRYAPQSGRSDALDPAKTSLHPILVSIALLKAVVGKRLPNFSYIEWHCVAVYGFSPANVACFTRQMLQTYMGVSEHDPQFGGNSGLGVFLCSAAFHWTTVPRLCRNMHTLSIRALSLVYVCLL
jgi:hypothetical protein